MAAYFELHQPRGRTRDHSITIYESDGSTGIVLAGTDKVRIKIHSGNAQTPDLDLLSGTASANDSLVTITQSSAPAKATLRIAQADTTDWVLGVYEVEVIVVDDSETAPEDAALHAMGGLLYLTGSGGGSLGLS